MLCKSIMLTIEYKSDELTNVSYDNNNGGGLVNYRRRKNEKLIQVIVTGRKRFELIGHGAMKHTVRSTY